MSLRLTLYPSLLGALVAQVPAQPARGASAVELVASEHMRVRHPAARLHLDPAFAEPGTAPGVRSPRRRPASRSRALAAALGARISADRGPAVVTPLLSGPVLAGDSATVSVTAVYPTGVARSPLGYETVALTLRRVGAEWRVARASQLGVS